jgi:hypothetical protein
MSYSEYTVEQEFLKSLHARINDRLDKDFKVSMPEWDRIDSTIVAHRDIITGRLLIQVNFVFDSNGLR